MAHFTESNLKQKAVYWGNPTPDGYGGTDYDAPVKVECRWVETINRITDTKGVEVVSTASVQVKQDLDVDGVLFLGTLDDLDSYQMDDPKEVEGAFPIKRFDKTPTMDGKHYFRMAYL